ncbi:uncharacterized protein BXZ73DRAFT_103694 [Epithele typhae]|uniref:uncharacterized protein n=1 Tax=Epithele typhae TaxID=378194 RepID=UPI00200782A0|nr:uncharacterized protein BXZ73DRAFT_103694 [Epithele typhae]KAH9923962.1 hypothetical protein BXZ73DRAFT_103694 [Epithele typhae]
MMEIDMVASMPYRTRSSTKRARSPESSPTQCDRPSKRAVSNYGSGVPLPSPPLESPAIRVRNHSEDWVSQTQDLRIESPALSIPGSGFNTPGSQPGEIRVDAVMFEDEQMMPTDDDRAMFMFPASATPAPTAPLLHLRPFGPHSASGSAASTPPQFSSPALLQIPLIQIQNATPSPVQPFPHPTFDLPVTQEREQAMLDAPLEEPRSPLATRRQRFTMGPRADCEQCRMRVPGHYAHF